jgi:hypothetical protein
MNKYASIYFKTLNEKIALEPQMIMPSMPSMIEEGQMDLANRQEQAPTLYSKSPWAQLMAEQKKMKELGVVEPKMMMPSDEQMIDEGKMDLANEPNPSFADEVLEQQKIQEQEAMQAPTFNRGPGEGVWRTKNQPKAEIFKGIPQAAFNAASK